MLRLATLVAILVFLTLPVEAQRADCIDGWASHQGTQYSCGGVDLLSRVTLTQMGAASGNDVWGWTDGISGREYALMGLDNGVFFVDVTNPEEPQLLGKLPTATQPSLWRDMKVNGDFMFVVSEASQHGMQVFDLNHLRSVAPDPTRVFQADLVFTGSGAHTIGRAHNIAINEDTGYAYIVGGRTQAGGYVCNGGLYMVDISQPLQPQFAGCFSADGYTHDVQCVVYEGPDTRYTGDEICLASNENTVTIVDVTNKSNPTMLSQAIYPNTGYTHQGWLTSDQRFFLVNDEFDESNYGIQTRSIVLDVSDLENPQFVGDFSYGTRAITHNLFLKDDIVYAANYMTGLRVANAQPLVTTRSVSSMHLLGHFDTYPSRDCILTDPQCVGSGGFRGAWSTYPYFASGTVLVSDINGGLFSVEFHNFPVNQEAGATGGFIDFETYPNPFGRTLVIGLEIPMDTDISVEIFDVLGRRVVNVHEGTLVGGTGHSFSVDTSALPAGVYLVRASGGGTVTTRSITSIGR